MTWELRPAKDTARPAYTCAGRAFGTLCLCLTHVSDQK